MVTPQLEIGRWLMACQFQVLLNAGVPTDGAEVALEALDVAERLEGLLSVYRIDSELSKINRTAAGESVRVSTETAELLTIGQEVREHTAGAFDLSAASLSELWGFSRRQGRMPDRASIEAAVASIAEGGTQVDFDRREVTRLRDDVPINSGGIGKGYALDRMASLLLSSGVEHFAVHGGHSSILAKGDRMDIDSSDGWRVAVRHPDRPAVILGELRLRDSALATSGPANQFFYYDGVRYSHIIDPRTGWPASGLLSITVLHPSAAWADALATGLFILGPEAIETYVANNRDTSVLMVLPADRRGEVEVRQVNFPQNVWLPAEK